MIQKQVMKSKGKTIMSANDWDEYLETRESVRDCIFICAPKWKKGTGASIVNSIIHTQSQRFHPNVQPLSDRIYIGDEWMTREQGLIVGCILSHENYLVQFGYLLSDEEWKCMESRNVIDKSSLTYQAPAVYGKEVEQEEAEDEPTEAKEPAAAAAAPAPPAPPAPPAAAPAVAVDKKRKR